MNLIVNIDALNPPMTGIGYFTREVLLCLLQDERVETITPLSSTGWRAVGDLPQLLAMEPSLPSVQSIDEPAGRAGFAKKKRLSVAKEFARKIPFSRNVKRLVQHTIARRNCAPLTAKYWEPNYIPIPIRQDFFPTIHDLSHRAYPQFHPRDRVRYLEKHLSAAMSRASHIFTVSRFSQQEIIREFNIPASRISVTSPGVSDHFKPFGLLEKKRVQQRFRLDKPFILSVCTLEPRKNILRLIDAYLALPEAHRSHYDLVLIGGEGWHSNTLREKLAAMPGPSGIRLLGYLPQDDKAVLMSAATILAYPSLYEGFGMPVLEAMASGTAVLTSKDTSMQEVCDGHAELIEPTSVESISAGIETLLDDEKLRLKLEIAGLDRAKNYRWRQSANLMVEQFLK